MSPYQFEKEIAQWYVSKGYKAKVTVASGDGGIDVILYKDNVTTYVQCKHYSMYTKIGVTVARELYGVMSADNVKNGQIVCLYSSSISEECEKFCDKSGIKIVTLKDFVGNRALIFDEDYTIKKVGAWLCINNFYIYNDAFNTKDDALSKLDELNTSNSLPHIGRITYAVVENDKLFFIAGDLMKRKIKIHSINKSISITY